MSLDSRPLVLVHGLWNNPNIFRRLVDSLPNFRREIFIPHLPHRFGFVPIKSLAEELNSKILHRYGNETHIDLLGFSMGGLVSRVWLQDLGGCSRTHKFLTIGTPHFGTLLAHLVPCRVMPGVADMKIKSDLLNDLNLDINVLEKLDCSSFYIPWDLMVVPGCKAILPFGLRKQLPAITHRGLVLNPQAIKLIIERIVID